MDDRYIVTSYVVVDDLLKACGYRDDVRCHRTAAEIITVAIVAAQYFQNHHERALSILIRLGYLGKLSLSRFNRRLHQLRDWLVVLGELLGEAAQHGQNVFIIDTFPLPACKRVRAGRCKKARGKGYYGYCAAKKEAYFGWQLHWVCTIEGVAVSFILLPAAWDELTLVHELLAHLPSNATVVGDKGYVSFNDAWLSAMWGDVRLLAQVRSNMHPLDASDSALIRSNRSRIETAHSQLTSMGLQHLHAPTLEGFSLKVHASLLALACHAIFSN